MKKWMKADAARILIPVFVIVFLGALLSMANEFQFHPKGHQSAVGPDLVAGLDLSEEQKAALADLLDAHYEDMVTTIDGIQQARQQLAANIHSEGMDEDSARKAFQEIIPVLEEGAAL